MSGDQKRSKFRIGKRLKWAILVSLLTHLSVLYIHVDIDKLNKNELAKKKENTLRVVLKERNKKTPKQIVTTERKGRKEKPLDSKYLSKHNQKVDRQTTAKTIGAFKKAGHGQRKGTEQVAKNKKIQKNVQKPSVVKKSKRPSRSRKFKKKTDLSFSDLSVGKEVVKKSISNQKKLAALGVKSGLRGQSGLAKNNDFVEDVPLGDVTALNTVEFKYYGFYHRIKLKLEQYWGNSLREKAEVLYRRGRRLPANINKITSLQITLDTKGNIVNIRVKGTSGIRELDDAAVESFSRAGPFPNPPQGMMKDGQAQIEWGFVVKS
jgi:TonB family protein